MRRSALALPLLLCFLAAGCIYSPAGRCDSAADCAADERCSSGVCVPAGSLGGVDPSSFTPVLWSTVATAASYAVDGVGADLSGNLVVAGTVDSEVLLGPSLVPPGAFALKLGSSGGAWWATSFPTFSHDRLELAVLPGGDVLFAGTAFEPAAMFDYYAPPPRGTLFVGQLAAANGAVMWWRAFDATHGTIDLVPVALAARGTDLVVAGRGSADFGCGDTGENSFAASLSGVDGHCLWSRGFRTGAMSDAAAADDGSVAVAGVCTPSTPFFDPGLATTCTGMFVAGLSGTTGASGWARTTSGAGAVTAVKGLALATGGRASVIGDATGAVSFGGAPVDFGAAEGSFAAIFAAGGAPGAVLRPIEAPYAAEPDALAFSRCVYDPSGRLWIAGTYRGRPTLGGVRFSACREPGCRAASFLARLEADGLVSSFLPLRAAPDPVAGAYVDDLALFATTGTIAHALRFTGEATVGGATWSSAGAGLGLLRAVP